MKENTELYISIILLLCSVYLEYSEELIKNIKTDLTHKNIIIGFIATISFCYFATTKNIERKDDYQGKLRESIKKALLAFIIGYLAHLDLIFVPFWIVFILAFFFHDWA